MSGVSFLPALRGKSFDENEYVFGERGWHHGPITRTDGFDLSCTIISEKYQLIYNVLPERMYTPVDMMKKNIAWEGIKEAHVNGELSDLHERLYFQDPRPIFELYDIEKDPFMLNNLSGRKGLHHIEESLRREMDAWMVEENDFVPLPSHAYELLKK